MRKAIQKVARKIRHTLQRSRIDKARAARARFLYQKMNMNWQAAGEKYEAAAKELKKPNPNMRIVNSAETLVRDTISDAEKTMHHISRIRRNAGKPGALSNRLDIRNVHEASIIWQCAKACQKEAKEQLGMLEKMKK